MLLKQIFAFRPSRMDLIFAVKTFIAGMIALFISFRLDLINPMWAIGTVIIIANPYSGMVSSKCVYRLIGTATGAIIALILIPPFINTPWLFSTIYQETNPDMITTTHLLNEFSWTVPNMS